MEISTIFVAIILTFIVGPLLRRWLRWRTFVSTIDKIPGPSKLPIIGTAHHMAGVKREELFERAIVKRHRDYPGGISRAWLSFQAEVRLAKPEYVEKVLSSSKLITKSVGYEMELQKWLGAGLISGTGEHWFRHRKIITPTFHFSILEGFCDVFAEKCDIMVKKLMEFADTGRVVDIHPFINLAALDIICETAMGITIDAQEKGESEYIKAVATLLEITMKRIMNPILQNEFIFSMTANGKRSQQALEILHNFTDNVIAERKLLRKQRQEEEAKNEFGKKERLAFLDLLLDVAEKEPFFTNKDIREEVDTFVFAGHDTTTMSADWALFLLGHHPEIQDKLFEEQREIFGDSMRLPTYKDLTEMKYMDRVMKECIRIYPTVGQVSRRATEEFEVGGYIIPVGTNVTISIWACSRDEKYFPDAEKFDPERWLPEKTKNLHPYAHIPFSAGPRNCVGQKFAKLEEKMMLSAMIRNFKFKSIDSREEVKVLPEVIYRPYPGIRLILEKRL